MKIVKVVSTGKFNYHLKILGDLIEKDQNGKWLNGKGIKTIVAVAAEHKVPIFCPAIADSAYGEAFLLAKSRGHNLIIDGVKDFYSL